jgi:hypothetical protein
VGRAVDAFAGADRDSGCVFRHSWFRQTSEIVSTASESRRTSEVNAGPASTVRRAFARLLLEKLRGCGERRGRVLRRPLDKPCASQNQSLSLLTPRRDERH